MAKKQGYNARLDDSLGSKNGKKSQSMKDRRDESEGVEKSKGKRKYSGNKSSAQGSPAKMNGDPKKKKTMEVKLGSSAKGYKRPQKTKAKEMQHVEKMPRHEFKKSPMNMSGKAYDNKEAYNKDLSASARLHYLENERHDDNSPAKMYDKKGSPAHMSRDLSYGGPVIDQEPKALSHMGASKVLKHMKSK